MLLRTFTLENFGIYGGAQLFDLTPQSSDQFDRPIVLISGKNGVGKTTFVEGLRLCLHGPLALGSRVGQQEYEDHLLRRIHRPLPHQGSSAPTQAAVDLTFDFVGLGKKQSYRVRRAWQIHNRRLVHEVCIWENGKALDALAPDERETLLRELAPPGLISIFFFDGEKIDALAQDTGSNLLLAETVHALLGLNLIDQLQRDLDLFLARRNANITQNGNHQELERLLTQQSALEQRRAAVNVQATEMQREIDAVRQQIVRQEAQIAAEGGSYAQRRQQLLQQRAHNVAQMDALHKQAIELAGGLLPFAIAPEMLRAVRRRLTLEQQHQEQQAMRQMIQRQLAVVEKLVDKEDIWQDGAQSVVEPVRARILRQVANSLRSSALGDEVPPSEVILHVSDKERGQLLQWIDQTLEQTPLTFSRLAQRLDRLETEQRALDADLVRAPADDVLAPLVSQLHDLLRQLGRLEQSHSQLVEEEQRVDYELEQTGFALRRARNAIEQAGASERRSDLAAKTQRVLDDYRLELTQRKLALLEQSLVSHFNQLCRKHAFVDRISVDPKSFALTLERTGHSFGREQLSAGENQLLAIAMLWALRELSGRATPVVIDTPLSRLDSQHRQSMLHDFFPHASHQVILLATDAEIDAAAQRYLAPVISHTYHMEYDAASGASVQRRETAPVKTPNLTLFGEDGLSQ